MSLFDAAQRIAEIDRLNVQYDSERCLHKVSKLANCEACFTICPVQAIKPGKPPTFENDSCANGFACLQVCPVNAFDALDAVPSLLECAARIESSKIELLCRKNSRPEFGSEPSAIAIRIRGCLAGIGSSAYLALAILGKTEILVRMEDCEKCELGSLKNQIRDQIDHSQTVLSKHPRVSITVIEDLEETSLGANRPLWDADNPPLSRRDLFRLASISDDLALAHTLSKNMSIQGRMPSRERLRTNTAISQLLDRGHLDETISLDGFHYALLSVNSDCSACGVCARACPTGALHFMQEENHFQLEFSPLDCIDCMICHKVCAEDAIDIYHSPSADETFARDGLQILIEGDLIRCARCSMWFSQKQDEAYCPTCNFRVQNPFGSRMPPGFQSNKMS
jgi:ferredoxin